jgi:hypothetical protein
MRVIDPDILTVLAFGTCELRDRLGVVAACRVCTDVAADGDIATARDDSDLCQHEGIVRAVTRRSALGTPSFGGIFTVRRRVAVSRT